jgi:predicted RND superfamily exporter protein
VDPIFVFTRFLGKLDAGLTREAAVIEALSELLLPCFLTSLTTALGFAAFMTATLPTIRYFGLVIAIGVSFAFVTTVTVLPLLMVSVRPPKRRMASSAIAKRVDACLVSTWHAIRNRRRLVLCAALAFIAIGGLAAQRLNIVNTYVGSLPRGSELDTVRELEDKLSGVVRFIVYLEGPPGSMKRPETLLDIEALEDLAKHQDIVTSASSLADLVGELNQAFTGGDRSARRIPTSANLIAQYLALVDPAERSEFVSDDYARSHVPILVRDRGSLAMWQLRDTLQAEIDRHFAAADVKASITGVTVAYGEVDKMVVEVLWGFVYAFLIIVTLEWLMFRSLRLALVSVIPNLVPVAACFLTMRLLRLDLRVEYSLVLCVSVGGLFNTTIHIIARVLQQVRAGATDADMVVEAALRTVGPPSLYTATILSAGFAVVGVSRFPGLQVFGLLSTVTLLTGFLADSAVTSTIIRSVFPWPSSATFPATSPSSATGGG